MKKIFFIILLTIPFICFGQGWEMKLLDNGIGLSVKQTFDDGYIIVGWKSGTNTETSYLIKTNNQGDTLWTKILLSDTITSYGKSIHQRPDGGYIISGHTNSKIYLTKTDSSGNQQWIKQFSNNTQGGFVEPTNDGGYIICGSIYTLVNNNDIYLIKTDSQGDTMWTKTYGGNESDKGYMVQQTTDGGYIICGSTKSSVPDEDIYLIKTDSLGNTQWDNVFNGNNSDEGRTVQQTTDGGYIICGIYDDYYSGGSDEKIYVLKTDSNGNMIWNNMFDGNTEGIDGVDIKQTTDNGYIISSTIYLTLTNSDVWLIKLDSNGTQQWDNSYGDPNSITQEVGTSVEQTNDGGYIICGGGDDGLYLIKTDGNGNITSTFNIPISSNRKLEKVVDILGRETKPQQNTPFIEIYDDGSTEKKIVIE
jgi:hypothetical protein